MGASAQSLQELAEGGLGRRLVFDRFAAVNFSDGFDLLGFFILLAFEGVTRVADGAAKVTEFVEFKDFIAKAAQHGDQGEGFFGVELGAENGLGEARGHDLEADFRDLGGVVAEEVGESILVQASLDEEGLVGAPLAIAAASGPIRDIAGSDSDAAFVEGLDDFVVGYGVGEHAIDHVALEFGQAGDFAIACFGF